MTTDAGALPEEGGAELPRLFAGGDARRAAPLQRALELAMRRLDRRDLTTLEMRRHLAGQDLSAETIDAALAELTAHGYIDDARFARLFADDRRRLDGWGADRIRRTLTGRGVAPELIADALAAGTDEEPEVERALAVLRRRFPVPPVDRRERDRALGVLMRKGYDGDVAVDALAAYARGD